MNMVFFGSAPEIYVRTRSIGNSVVIEVEDNGPGIKDEIRKRIFEPFSPPSQPV